ncbi:MAG: hypothetical protein AAF757_06105 [Cyanobacteria bacterium P01_D01_bin.116]
MNQVSTTIVNMIFQKLAKRLICLASKKKQQNRLCSRNKISRWKIGSLEFEQMIQETYHPPKLDG